MSLHRLETNICDVNCDVNTLTSTASDQDLLRLDYCNKFLENTQYQISKHQLLVKKVSVHLTSPPDIL